MFINKLNMGKIYSGDILRLRKEEFKFYTSNHPQKF
jgi:hypothetical protein